LALETDGYFRRMLTDVGHPEWSTSVETVCHVNMAKTGKRALQYPPGVGAVLAMFPEGHQVVPLYVTASLFVLAMALLAIFLARSRAAVVGAGLFGCLALYFMVNPAKASYSVAPTMVLCALAGFLTAKMFNADDRRQQWLLAALLGFLLGLSVNFRIPNLLLFAGYGIYFLAAFIAQRSVNALVRGALFGVAGLVGLTPTLIANALNAGSPIASTYGGQDVSPPDLSFSIIPAYLGDLQGVLIIASIAGTIALFFTRQFRPIVAIIAINLVVNLGFFLSHPVFTQYYLIPLAMLSLWTLMFAPLVVAEKRTA
jgi:4-amino-4-deoxy-L-arabinose transferase-like glycosyltransferase